MASYLCGSTIASRSGVISDTPSKQASEQASCAFIFVIFAIHQKSYYSVGSHMYGTESCRELLKAEKKKGGGGRWACIHTERERERDRSNGEKKKRGSDMIVRPPPFFFPAPTNRIALALTENLTISLVPFFLAIPHTLQPFSRGRVAWWRSAPFVLHRHDLCQF